MKDFNPVPKPKSKKPRQGGGKQTAPPTKPKPQRRAGIAATQVRRRVIAPAVQEQHNITGEHIALPTSSYWREACQFIKFASMTKFKSTAQRDEWMGLERWLDEQEHGLWWLQLVISWAVKYPNSWTYTKVVRHLNNPANYAKNVAKYGKENSYDNESQNEDGLSTLDAAAWRERAMEFLETRGDSGSAADGDA